MDQKREQIAEGIVTYTGEGAMFLIDKLVVMLSAYLGPFGVFALKIFRIFFKRIIKKKTLKLLREGKREMLYLLDVKNGELVITEIDKALHDKNKPDFINAVFDNY